MSQSSTRPLPVVQERILALLADGMPHPREELMKCLQDETAHRKKLNGHLCIIRKRISRRGEDIVCQLLNRKLHYRHVRLLSNPYDGS